MRIREIAKTRVSYGYRRIHVMLLREGWKINHKRVYRLYKEEGLLMRSNDPEGTSQHVGGWKEWQLLLLMKAGRWIL